MALRLLEFVIAPFQAAAWIVVAAAMMMLTAVLTVGMLISVVTFSCASLIEKAWKGLVSRGTSGS